MENNGDIVIPLNIKNYIVSVDEAEKQNNINEMIDFQNKISSNENNEVYFEYENKINLEKNNQTKLLTELNNQSPLNNTTDNKLNETEVGYLITNTEYELKNSFIFVPNPIEFDENGEEIRNENLIKKHKVNKDRIRNTDKERERNKIKIKEKEKDKEIYNKKENENKLLLEHLNAFNVEFDSNENNSPRKRREKFDSIASESLKNPKFKREKKIKNKNQDKNKDINKNKNENNIFPVYENNFNNKNIKIVDNNKILKKTNTLKNPRINKNNFNVNNNNPYSHNENKNNLNVIKEKEKERIKSPQITNKKQLINNDNYKKNFLKNNFDKLNLNFIPNKIIPYENIKKVNSLDENKEKDFFSLRGTLNEGIKQKENQTMKLEKFKNKLNPINTLDKKIRNHSERRIKYSKGNLNIDIIENKNNKTLEIKNENSNEGNNNNINYNNNNEIEFEEIKENYEDKLVRRIIQSRNSDYLKTLNMKIKNKQQENEEKQKREEYYLRKMKENLGLAKIKSKILDGTKEFSEDLPIKTKAKSIIKNKKNVNTPMTQETNDTLVIDEDLIGKDKDKDKESDANGNKIYKNNKLKELKKKLNSKIETLKESSSETQTTLDNEKEKDKEKEKEKCYVNLKKKENKIQQQTEKEKIFIQERSIKLKNCYTLEDWKRRNRVSADKFVFSCFPGYPDMRKALLDRGWIENLDPTSIFFDLKFALGGRNIDFKNLQKTQFVNHFQRNGEITRKVSLMKNLKNMVWYKNIDVNAFFPRCFDLSDQNDFDNFCNDFKVTKAESYLKLYLNDKKNITIDKVKICLNIIKRKMMTFAEILENPNFNFRFASDKEWEIIIDDETTKELKYDRVKNLDDNIIKEKYLKSPKNDQEEKKRAKSLDIKIKKIKQKNEENNIENDPSLKNEVSEFLEKFKNINLQYNLNGDSNIWIVKPSGLSRGRGIKCIDELDEIVNQVKSGANQFIIQKYIENPLIINKKKFDIRQWVIVTDWNPLTIYKFNEPYVRFGAEEYDPNNLNNLYSHLTNNAIGKNSDQYDNSDIKENMWDLDSFQNYLKKTFNSDIYKEILEEKIDSIIINSLEPVQDLITSRKNSHETYGFDIMVDEDFNTWLLEINSSPCMDYSTEITKKLVKEYMEDTCKLIIDNIFMKNKDSDIGKWRRIHKGPKIEEVNLPPGFELYIEGSKYNLKDEINFED